MRDALLVAHVGAGALGLLLGAAWLLRWRGRRAVGAAYQGCVAVVVLTSVVLVVRSPGLAWLLPVALATQVASVAGVVVRRRRVAHWPAWHAHLLGGSYVALVTGLALGSTGDPLFWVLPAVLAQPPIAVAEARIRRAHPVPGGAPP